MKAWRFAFQAGARWRGPWRAAAHAWCAWVVGACVACGIVRAAEERSLSEEYASAVARLSFEQLSPAVVDKVLWTLTDCAGVLVYTSQLEEVLRYRDLTVSSGAEEATEWVAGTRVSLAQAAAVNAFALHGHEVDDSNLRNQLRASCVALPAPWAWAEAKNTNGREFLTALAASYHVADRLATFMNAQPGGQLHARGWMPSSVCGVVGSAAAAGKLAGLSEEQLASAIALAAGGANGTFAYYPEGTDEKKIHVARAAALAIESVRLAQSGFRGARGSLDGPAGLLVALGFPPEREKLVAELERFDAILHVKPKFFSCSQGVIPWLETLAPLLAEQGVRPQQVRAVRLHVAQPAESVYVRKINHFQPPRSIMEAQLSVNYCVALLLCRGSVFVDDFSIAGLEDAQVLSVARRVQAVHAPGRLGELALELADGRMLTARYPASAFTAPYVPVAEDYRTKFRRLTRRLSTAQAAAIERHIRTLVDAPRMAEWCGTLRELFGPARAGASRKTEPALPGGSR